MHVVGDLSERQISLSICPVYRVLIYLCFIWVNSCNVLHISNYCYFV
jgi:hypothetical protein